MSPDYHLLLPSSSHEKGSPALLLHRASRHNRFLYLLISILLIALTYNYYSFEDRTPCTSSPTSSSSNRRRSDDLVYRGVVESMDGVGYEFSDVSNVPLDPRFSQLERLPECHLEREKQRTDVGQLMRKWSECITPIIRSFNGDALETSLQFVEKTKVCDEEPLLASLDIQPFNNQHETKWVVLPRCRENNTMVTLGVGHDTKAEELLNRTLPLTSFFGADPIIEPNIQLYSPFGKFFPFAVGRQSGLANFKVLPNQSQKTRRYVRQDVTTIEINYFLQSVLRLERIDIMWIDIEGAEFEFLDYLHRGAAFDEHRLTICQFNVEMHPVLREHGYQQFMEFVDKVLDQKRWMFLRPRLTGKGVFRMFFINLEDPKCIAKFIP